MVFNFLNGKSKFREEVFRPMEGAKHSSVDEIPEAFLGKFKILYSVQQNAFVGTPVMKITEPDRLRYILARLMIGLDRLLCKVRITKLSV